MVVYGGKPSGAIPGAFRRPAFVALEDRTIVGDQGVAARPVELQEQRMGVAALETLVLLGDAFAFEICGEDGEDDPRASGQCLDVLRTSHH